MHTKRVYGNTPCLVGVRAGGVVTSIDDRFVGKNVVVVDVFPRNHEAIASVCKSFLILDHHAGAEGELLATRYGVYSPTLSGVGMAWAFVAGSAPLPPIYALIQERDLYRFSSESNKTTAAGLLQLINFADPDVTSAFASLDALLVNPDVNEFVVFGRLYAKMIRDKAVTMVKASTPNTCVFNGRPLEYRIFNALWEMTSDLGEVAMETTASDFVVVWQYNHELPETPYKVSLRSSPRGVNTIDIAQHFGGNGHRDASGFDSAVNPQEALSALSSL
jgi:hypothetical protein